MDKRRIFIGVVIVVALHYVFYLLGTIKVTAHFEELEPFPNNLPVYYKGFRMGRTVKIYPGENYRTTYIDMRLKNKNLHLPQNVTVILKRKDKKDYVELVYPNTPYIAELKHGDSIEGTVGMNLENFLQDQASSGGLDEIKNNVNVTVKSAGETFDALTKMLNVLTGILEDVRPEINDTVKNVNHASKNLASVSDSLKNTVDKGYVDSALYNLQETSGNLVVTTKNFGGFTETLNRQSTVLVNCLLQNLNIVVKNINQIVVGVGETLKKRFGGLRLFFGKTG